MQRTLLIIKPDAVEERHAGEIISMIEKKGIFIRNIKMEQWTKEKAENFYEVHRDKPFFNRLINFMTSGPVIEMILEYEDCVRYVRKIVGATDPAEAEEGTIRKLFAQNVTVNAVHASDSPESAEKEINFIFRDSQYLIPQKEKHFKV